MVRITIFGNPGTGTSSVGKFFADRNNFKFISSGDIFRAMANDFGFGLYEFSKLCQNDSKYDIDLDRRIVDYSIINDNFVMDSRLGWYLIETSVKIKLVCDFDLRVKRISIRDDVSIDFAREKTLFREKSESMRFTSNYSIDDFGNNKYFDLVINSSDKSVLEIVGEIEKFILNKKN